MTVIDSQSVKAAENGNALIRTAMMRYDAPGWGLPQRASACHRLIGLLEDTVGNGQNDRCRHREHHAHCPKE